MVDSASIEVNRRAKRAKTDQLDVGKLLRMLIRYDSGEKRAWSVVRVPSMEAEDNRHLHRQLKSMKVERTQHINRLKGLLVGQGVRMSVGSDFMQKLARVRLGDGSALPAGLWLRLEREYACLTFVKQHIAELETERRQVIRRSDDPSAEQVRQLLRLRGIGENSAWLFVMEFFSWREFHNRREVGCLVGLAPTPHQSGDEAQEQGIDKSGNCSVRTIAIETDFLPDIPSQILEVYKQWRRRVN